MKLDEFRSGELDFEFSAKMATSVEGNNDVKHPVVEIGNTFSLGIKATRILK